MRAVKELLLRAYESGEAGADMRQLDCLITLHIFCKADPRLLVPHVDTLRPMLSEVCALTFLRSDPPGALSANHEGFGGSPLSWCLHCYCFFMLTPCHS